jgi:tetratricopeptide (TPR) repeat protein
MQSPVRDPIGLLVEYRQLVEGYLKGGIDGIQPALKAWDARRLNDAISLVEKQRRNNPAALDTTVGRAELGGWNMPLLGAAALLHTDAFLHGARRRRLDYIQLSLADRLLSAYGGSTAKPAFKLQLSLVIIWIRQITGDLPAVRGQLAAMQRDFPGEPRLAMVEGGLEEAQASPRAARTASSRGALGRAETSFRRALSLDAQFAEARVHLGYVLFRLGRTGEARSELERAATDAREWNVQYLAMLLLGGVYEHTRHMADAVNVYRRAHALAPSCQVAAIALAHALYSRGDRSEAAAVAGEVGADPTACDDPWWSYDYGEGWRVDATMKALQLEVRR